MEYRIKRINQATRGWLNYFRLGKGIKKQLQKLDGWIRYYLRIIYWKQWKTVRNRANYLYLLKMPKWACWRIANSRKSYARVARYLPRWITNALFEGKALISLEKYHDKIHVTQLHMSIY